MPKCAVCDEKFYHATHLDPPEPCDCGLCEDSSYIETEEDAERVSRARRRWKDLCDRAAAGLDMPERFDLDSTE